VSRADLFLLKVFEEKSVYERYIGCIKFDILENEIKTILGDYRVWFEEHGENINWDKFPMWFHHYRHPDISDSQHVLYKKLFENVQEIESVDLTDVLLDFEKRKVSYELLQHLEAGKFNLSTIKEYLSGYEEKVGEVLREEDPAFYARSLDDALASLSDMSGLKWRLNCLNEYIKPLRVGKFIVVGAATHVGKTIFATSEIAHMAQQLTEGKVLWFNNEQMDDELFVYFHRAVLGCSKQVLNDNLSAAKSKYSTLLHGDYNRIQIVDIREKTWSQVKVIISEIQPKLIVFDQLDKVNTPQNFKRDDLRLEYLYRECRKLSCTVAPIIAICQADSTTTWIDQATYETKYTLFPHHRQLHGSKIGKQGEAETVIMLGIRNGYPNVRGLSVTKNKFGENFKKEVNFDGERLRYTDDRI
jgi:replicative DNA helicase